MLILRSAPCCPLLRLPCIWPCRMRFQCRGSGFLCSTLGFDCLSTNNPCFANLPDLSQPCFSACACACAEQGCAGFALGCLSFYAPSVGEQILLSYTVQGKHTEPRRREGHCSKLTVMPQTSPRRRGSQENALLIGRTSRGLTSQLEPVLAGFLPPSALLVNLSSVGLASSKPLYVSGWGEERNHPTEQISESPTFLPRSLKAAR